MVKCQICNKEYQQITATHLKNHNTNLVEYQNNFPNAEIVDHSVKIKIKNKNKGRPKSKEFKKKMSDKIKAQFKNGRKQHNEGQKGAWRTMPEEERKMRGEIRKGAKHSEEAKRKIGNAHRGKTISEEQKKKFRISYSKFLEENNGSPQKGMKRNAKTKQQMSASARKRTDAYVSEKVQLMNAARIGQKETDEQKQRKSDARLKYMKENPDKLPSNMFDTRPELEFEEELISRNITYQKQFHTQNPHKLYDFLVAADILVEIDGPYHYNERMHPTQELFEKQVKKDEEKNRIAKKKGYKIFRIKVGSHLPNDWKDQLLEQGLNIDKL